MALLNASSSILAILPRRKWPDDGCQSAPDSSCLLDHIFSSTLCTSPIRTSCARALGNVVDGDTVPTRHFGLILDWSHWHELARHLETEQQEFLIAPKTRFVGEAGEQATFFLLDPAGNALEFKSFKDPNRIFAHDE